MNMYTRIIISAVLIFSLCACLEVENDDGDVAAAIERQNELIEEQNNAIAGSVTLFGSVNILNSDTIPDARVRVKVGLEWLPTVATVDGDFEIAGVPPSSDYELLVESSSSDFVQRVKFGVARNTNAALAYQDVGVIDVSRAITRSFSILDTATNLPVEGLVFKGFSHLSNGSGADDYAHISSFNDASGTYDIVLPEYIEFGVSANLDLNLDGEPDFSGDGLFGNNLLIRYDDFDAADPIFLSKSAELEYQQLLLRVSVVDAQANSFSDLVLTIDDSINGLVSSNFDEDSKQHILEAQIDTELSILIPAFTVDDVFYASSTVRIRRNVRDEFTISSANSENSYSYRLPADISVLDLALQPRRMQPSSLLALAYSSTELGADNSAKFFYSSPVTVSSDEISLTQLNAITVTRGDDDENDLVPNGTTSIIQGDVPFDVNTMVSLNNTLLTLTPAVPLPEGANFRMNVGNLTDQYTGLESDLNLDTKSFSTLFTSTFDVASLVLDNDNYTAGGEVIEPMNTLGDAASPSNRFNSVNLYMPVGLADIHSLSVVKRLVTVGDDIRPTNVLYRIVDRSDSRMPRSINTVRVAENENLTGAYNSVSRGTSLADGRYHYIPLGEFMGDHTGAQTNTIAFDYVLERINGDVETGQITLEVQ